MTSAGYINSQHSIISAQLPSKEPREGQQRGTQGAGQLTRFSALQRWKVFLMPSMLNRFASVDSLGYLDKEERRRVQMRKKGVLP